MITIICLGIVVGSMDSPKERLKEATQGRHTVLWHDHSEIAGKYLSIPVFVAQMNGSYLVI